MAKKKWKIGFNTFWWEGLSDPKKAEACIQSLVDIGYDAIEFKIDSFGPDASKEAVVHAANEARKAGLIVSNLVILRALTGPDTWEKSVADISEVIRICAAAEIGAVNFATGGPALLPTASPDDWWELPQTRPDPTAWDTLVRSLESLAKVADAEGVDLALEAVIGNLVSEFSSTLELFSRFDHPRLKLTFDPSHYVLVGQDIRTAILRLGPRIRHVHFKDAVGRAGAMGKDFIFPLLGAGATDWKVFLEALSEVNYEGVLSIEYESFRFANIVLKGDVLPAARLSKIAADALISSYGG